MTFSQSSAKIENQESLLGNKDTEYSLEVPSCIKSRLHWFKVLLKEMHWSFVYGIVIANGVSQGLAGAIYRVASDYYWKDVQKIEPSVAQMYQGITSLPWVLKPLWGLLSDIMPVAGYRRRPYFIFAGILGAVSMIMLWLENGVGSMIALLFLTGGSAGIAIGDVTIDACVAQNSITHPTLVADMQSLCGLSSSIGGLVGYFITGQLMHAISSKVELGLLSIPFTLLLTVGFVMKETQVVDYSYKQTYKKLVQANRTIWVTLKCSEVSKSCIYMYFSLALSLSIQEGMFYWYTDADSGPSFSQGIISFIFCVGSLGSLLGVFLYQNFLKDYPFRSLLLWSQLLSGISGMLDLMLVLRWNLKLGMPDHLFVMFDESISQMIGRLKWMPLLVLSSKLCPCGIEGTFFALLMSVDHAGMLTASWGGGLLLEVLKVTRTEFSNLWIAIMIRNVMRVIPLFLLHLVPKSDPNSRILPMDVDSKSPEAEENDMAQFP